jgi:hypothetical protein
MNRLRCSSAKAWWRRWPPRSRNRSRFRPRPLRWSVDLDRLRREAAHAVTDALGPMADAVALRIERAKDADQLRSALRLAAEALDNIGPHARAEAFRSRFLNF